MKEKTLHGLGRSYVYNHGINIWHLGDDMLFMYREQRYAAPQVFIRSMLESCLLMGATINNNSFAVEKMIGEFQRSKDMYQEQLTTSSQKDLIKKQIKFLNEDIAELQNAYGNEIGNRRWSKMSKVAEQANMLPRYIREYHYMSQHTHGTAEGISRMQNQMGRGNALQSGTTSIIVGGNVFVVALDLVDKKEFVTKLHALKTTQDALCKNGAYAKLDAKRV